MKKSTSTKILKGSTKDQKEIFLVQHPTTGMMCEVKKVEYDPSVPVNTYWDLGKRDSTAIEFVRYLCPDEEVSIDISEELKAKIAFHKIKEKMIKYISKISYPS